VKLSRRIAQFLVVLLEYEKLEVDKSLSLHRRTRGYQLERFFYGRTHHLVPEQFEYYFKASTTLRSTFRRTIRIMLRQGLVSYETDFYDITLTEKGRKTAVILEKEAREYIEDFSFLLNRKT